MPPLHDLGTPVMVDSELGLELELEQALVQEVVRRVEGGRTQGVRESELQQVLQRMQGAQRREVRQVQQRTRGVQAREPGLVLERLNFPRMS